MKIAVITGASSGMGREFVRQIPHFYMNLDELWIISRRKDRLEAIAKTCSVPVRIFAGDLTDPMFLQTGAGRKMGSSNGIRTVPDRMGCCIRCLSDCRAAVAVDCI